MSGTANKKYLEFVIKEVKDTILKDIADHYGITSEEAYEEVTDEDAEYLYEYVVADYRGRMYNQMTNLGL